MTIKREYGHICSTMTKWQYMGYPTPLSRQKLPETLHYIYINIVSPIDEKWQVAEYTAQVA